MAAEPLESVAIGSVEERYYLHKTEVALLFAMVSGVVFLISGVLVFYFIKNRPVLEIEEEPDNRNQTTETPGQS